VRPTVLGRSHATQAHLVSHGCAKVSIAVHELSGRDDVVKRIEEAEALLRSLRNALAHDQDRGGDNSSAS
jgi:hypothetical protein